MIQILKIKKNGLKARRRDLISILYNVDADNVSDILKKKR